MENVVLLLLALGLDLAFGDPRDSRHPVAWLGKVIAAAMKPAPRGKARQIAYGTAVVLVIVALATAAAWFGFGYLRETSTLAYVVFGAVALKLTFALRGLRTAALDVKRRLAAGRPDAARNELKALVGRDTARLDESRMVSAVVESVAENSTDSFMAPLFYFAIFGIPGAVAYRVINTFDSMIGHHGRWEYLGKFAARLDDAANFVPARLSALLLALAAGLSRLSLTGAWRVMLRDRRLTESPNAGWTMSAAAGALGVQLEKVGYYRLGDNGRALSAATINDSLRLLTSQALLGSFLCVAVEVIRAAFA